MNTLNAGIKKLQQKQALLRALIFSFVTIIIWIGFSIFRTQQTTGISPELLKLAEPINPNIDITVLDRLEAKRSFTTAELTNFPINRLIVENGIEKIVRSNGPSVDLNTATISATPTASASAGSQ